MARGTQATTDIHWSRSRQSIHMPLIPTVIVYLLGLIVGNHLAIPWTISYVGIISLIFISIASIIRNRPILRIAAILTLFWLLGIVLINLHLRPHFPRNHIFHYANKERVNVEGILYRRSISSSREAKLYLKVEKIHFPHGFIKARGNVLISVKEYHGDLRYGDRIRFIAKLYRPRNFNNPGGFDYGRFLACKGIWVTAYVEKNTGIVTIARSKGNPFLQLIEAWRERIRTLLEKRTPVETRGIMKALILGEREEMREEMKEEFVVAGVAHIIAISGLHMGIIALVVFLLMKWSLRWSETLALTLNIQKISALATIPPLVLYTFIAGARISTVRAAIMIVIYLISILLDRQRNLYNTLAVAAFLILLVSPSALFDVSFQLSFVAVLAILYLVPRLSEFLPKTHPLLLRKPSPYQTFLSHLKIFIFVSLAAMVGTSPLVAYYFNRMSIVGLLSNLIIIPLAGFVVIIGLITSLATLIWLPVSSLLVTLTSALSSLVIKAVHLFASIPYASQYVVTPTFFEIGLFYFLILYLANLKRIKRLMPISILLLAVIAGDISYWYTQTHLTKGLRATFIDVGQGDSILIEFPMGKRMLIDGGGFYEDSFDVGRNVVAPVLWRRKIATLHYLVLTHPHPDHLNGLKFIADSFKVHEFWENGQQYSSVPYLDLMDIVARRKIHRITVHEASPPRWINGVKVEVLNPPQPGIMQGRNLWSQTNNRSMVLKITFKNHRFLLTGDIEEEAEAQLIQSGKDLRSDVVKVPHHGSKTSSTRRFLEAVKPSHSVFTVGLRNIFNLPSTNVLNRYERAGCQISRTDRDGAVSFETDGENMTVTLFLRPSNAH
ncbi:MAG: DNA internalization-related competence protein ComEC/Rec2 [Proteobacteria bacterium]|nr:DNA internalization-related competence protein ComEC/Rec2 [Pseudomonadota bacterium]